MNTVDTNGGAAQYTGNFSKFLIIYACILVLAALQFVIAYTATSTYQMFFRMFLVAIVEAGLAIMFFMHVGSERRNFVTWLAIITIFVMLAMQYSWTDSYRMELGVPGAQPKTGAVQ